MKQPRELLLVSLGFALSLVLIAGCAANIQERNPAPKDVTPPQETTQAESELEVKQEQNEQVTEDCEAIRSELVATQAKYSVLQYENSQLDAKFNTLTTDYEELNDNFNALTANYNDLLMGTPVFTESDAEQAIFEVINQDRQNNGLNELDWTDTFYQFAKSHSDYMATRKKYELSELSYYQEIFRTAGYSTLDRMSNATLMVWKENITYEMNILNPQAKYGTVGVTKSGDIFYITFFADTRK